MKDRLACVIVDCECVDCPFFWECVPADIDWTPKEEEECPISNTSSFTSLTECVDERLRSALTSRVPKKELQKSRRVVDVSNGFTRGKPSRDSLEKQ